MEIIEGKNYLTVKELMEKLNMSNTSTLKYIKQGKVKAIRIKGKWLITEESYKDLLTPKDMTKYKKSKKTATSYNLKK